MRKSLVKWASIFSAASVLAMEVAYRNSQVPDVPPRSPAKDVSLEPEQPEETLELSLFLPEDEPERIEVPLFIPEEDGSLRQLTLSLSEEIATSQADTVAAVIYAATEAHAGRI